MIFWKILLKNFRKSIYNYKIYLFTLIVMSGLLMAANLLSVVMELNEDRIVSNSLPALIIIVALLLSIYINNYMMSERSEELANYMLAGIERKYIGWIFIGQIILFSLLAIAPGVMLGYTYCYLGNRYFFAGLNWREINHAIWSSCGRACLNFLIMQILLCIYVYISILNISIKKLICKSAQHEKRICYETKRYILLGMGSITILIISVIEKNLYLVSSMGFFSIIVLVFSGYSLMFGILNYYRDKKRECILNNQRIFIIANLLKEQQTNRIYAIIMSLSIYVAYITSLTGYVFIRAPQVLISKDMDNLMGTIQSSMAILFFFTIFTLLSIRQLTALKKYNKKYLMLMYLGINKVERKKIFLRELLISHLFPVALGEVAIIISTPIISIWLKEFFDVSVMGMSASIMAIVSILFVGYLGVVYFSYNKHV